MYREGSGAHFRNRYRTMGRERWGLKRSGDVCRGAGITYRQLRHWVEIGVVTPSYRALGTGDNHLFDQAAERRIADIKLLRRAEVSWKGVRLAVKRGYAGRTAELIRAVLIEERQRALEEA